MHDPVAQGARRGRAGPWLGRAFAAALLQAGAWPAGAADAGLRGGDHPGYGRIVVDLPEGAGGAASQEADLVSVRLSGASFEGGGAAGLAIRNLRRAVAAGDLIEISVAHGARLRFFRLSDRLVVDLLDPVRGPASAVSAATAAAAAPAPPRAPVPVPVLTEARASAIAGPKPAMHSRPPSPPEPGPIAARPAEPATAEALPSGSHAAEAEAARAPSRERRSVEPPDAPPPKAAASSTADRQPEPPPDPDKRHVATPETADRVPPQSSVLSAHEDATHADQPEPPHSALPLEPAKPVLRPEAGTLDAASPMPLALAASMTETELALPFSPRTGAAAFDHGEWSYVVFDERRPIDLSREQGNAAFPQATVQLLPEATMLRFRREPGSSLSLTHDGAVWTVSKLGKHRTPSPSFKPRRIEGGVVLAANAAGRVVAVPNSDTGGSLLVGTLREAGQSVPIARRAVPFTLWATWLGVVVEPVLDTARMRVTPEGFALDAGPGRDLGLSEAFVPEAVPDREDALTRQFDLPALPIEAMLRRLHEATRAAAAAPAQARTDKRLGVARALLGLGLGVEAQGVAATIVRDDPRAAARPDVLAMAGIAALLAGRVGESDALLDDRLPANDEIAFWRGVRDAGLARDPHAAAAGLAARIGLLLSYPAPLREHVLALVGETLAAGDQPAALDRLDKAWPDDRRLVLARALAGEAGEPGPEALDKVSQLPDRRMRAKAAVLAVEQRLAKAEIDAGTAADRLGRLLYAWRDDAGEVALRERVAVLRARAGAPRDALSLLRETAGLWPGQAKELRARMTNLLQTAISPDAQPPLPPLAFVAMVEDNPDLVPDGRAGEQLAAMLADRLGALDLPERAAIALSKLVAAAPPGIARATLGLRLAGLSLAREAVPDALAALRDSEAEGLPDELRERREIVRAQARIAGDDRAGALATLAALTSPRAVDLRASLLEQAHDWRGAGRALAGLLDSLPTAGPLEVTEAKLVLRATSDAAQAGDEARLKQLRSAFHDRMSSPELARVFNLLTEAPVRDTSELPRSGREMAQARQLPREVEAIGGPRAVTR